MSDTRAAMQAMPPGTTRLGWLLGDAVEASRRGRLSHFIRDEHSPAIALFDPETVAANEAGDWYGEHAGKWLVATARAAAGDAALRESVIRVADRLVALQDADGYLGTYAPTRRFMVPQPPKPITWDGAPALRTWDIWTHSYLILGLIEVYRLTGLERYLSAACAIGDLAWRTLSAGGITITDLGNHFGLSASVLLDPAVELFAATGQGRYLNLARLIVDQLEREPRNRLLSAALEGEDPSQIATGKAYQLLWNLVGLAKLHRATGDPRYLDAVHAQWTAVRDAHLTLGGGPWGGVAHRSREVFNAPGAFHPTGYVETCSTMAWIQLNRELLTITGDPRFAEEIERSAYNDLLGAAAPNGEDWCYYSFANGRRVHTAYWRCCKSSGAMALEELPAIAYAQTAGGGVAVNLLGPSSTRIDAPGGAVHIDQETDYPATGDVRLTVGTDAPHRFPLLIRVPQWADGAHIMLPDGMVTPVAAGAYARIERVWQGRETVTLSLPMAPRLHHATNRNVQESFAPDGSPVAQEVLREDYVAFARGPLVYATGLVDGYRTAETLHRPVDESRLMETIPADRGAAPDILVLRQGAAPLRFEPFYAVGGRRDGAWRLTWLSLAPDGAGVPEEDHP